MEKDYLKIAGNIHLSYYVAAADKLGIKYEIIIRSLLARFEDNGKHWFIINTALPVNNVTSVTISKRKNLTYKILKAGGIPVAKQLEAENYEQVLEFFNKYKNIVLKPVQNLGGKGVSILPRNEQELKSAYDLAVLKNLSKTKTKALAEEFFKGENYRLLVCGDEVIGAVYRKAASVIGDGTKTISQLIEAVNLERKDRLLMPIKIDDEIKKCLDTKGISIETVLESGQEVLLRFNANLTTGGTTEECLSIVHPYYLDLAVKAVKTIGLKVGGLDLIAQDITKEGPCIINEINYNPGLRLHYKVDKGEVSDVAVKIMEFVRENV